MHDHSLHVIVVDDHDDTLDMMRHFLERRGMRVSTAASADDALRIVADLPVDVIVTDLSLGGEHDGLWLLDRVRRHGVAIPLIAMTGHAERISELHSVGFAAVFVKPIVQHDDLVGVIRGVTRR